MDNTGLLILNICFFGLNLIITLGLGLIAILYPLKVSKTDYNLTKDALSEITNKISETNILASSTHYDIKEINKTISLKEIEQKTRRNY